MPTSTKKSTTVRSSKLVRVGPIAPGDAECIVDTVFAGLLPQSRFFRFHSPIPQLSVPLRRMLVDLDGHHRAAVVAEIPGPRGATPVGIARLGGDGTGAADIAVAVVDAWQRHGIGRRLLAAVAGLAEEIGYTELRGLVLPGNAAMQGLLRSAYPQARARFDGDAVVFTVPIGAAEWTVTHEDLLAALVS